MCRVKAAILTTALWVLIPPIVPGSAAVAQGTPPAAEFEGMVEVSEVLLDVLAVDRSGRIVTGLGKDDFIVKEDGEAVEVTGVSFYATRYGPEGGRLAEDGAVPSSRYFVFFFHDQTHGGSIGSYMTRRQSRARRDSLRWIEEHMLPSDWVAIASYDLKLKIHQDFTQDRAALAQGMTSAMTRRDPERSAGRRGRILPPSGAPSLLRHLPEGKTLRRASRTPYDAIRLLAEAAGWIVGRKNLLLFSTGFGELVIGDLSSEPDRRRYPPMEQALNDHNVAVYPIDLTPPEVNHTQARFMIELALDTGGQPYRYLSRFLPALEQISEDNAGYYLISYQSQHPAAEAGYQRVEVRARDRSVQLRARKGYRYGS